MVGEEGEEKFLGMNKKGRGFSDMDVVGRLMGNGGENEVVFGIWD